MTHDADDDSDDDNNDDDDAHPALLVAGAVTSPCTISVTTLTGAFTETAPATFIVARQVRYYDNRRSDHNSSRTDPGLGKGRRQGTGDGSPRVSRGKSRQDGWTKHQEADDLLQLYYNGTIWKKPKQCFVKAY